MSKITKINVKNLKAIGEMMAEFNGCSAIVTAGNNKGKTTFLRSLPDRIRGEKPELIVKQGEENGEAEILLTTGEKFTWSFTKDGKEKLAFVTKEGYRTPITKEIAHRFFPPLFDIDKFLTSQPKEQSKLLQKTLGIDLTAEELEYKSAFDDRTLKNRLVENAKLGLLVKDMTAPKEPISTTDRELRIQNNDTILDRRKEVEKTITDRDTLLSALDTEKTRFDAEEAELKKTEEKIKLRRAEIKTRLAAMETERANINKDKEDIQKRLSEDAALKPLSDEEKTKLQSEIDDDKLQNAKIDHNKKADEKLAEYNKAKEEADKADAKVKEAEAKKAAKIKSVSLPDGLSFGEDGLLYNNLPLDKKQISTSGLYIIALKLASMNIGEVKSLYFDASPLDRKSLEEIEAWAHGQGLQLLIEMPAFDGGEIEYQIISEVKE